MQLNTGLQTQRLRHLQVLLIRRFRRYHTLNIARTVAQNHKNNTLALTLIWYPSSQNNCFVDVRLKVLYTYRF